ncbi:MAG: sulfite exporter TauE/SafE family protein [Myxococcota bacterium]
MDALFATVLGASLLGSLHCAGMCGPLVAVYASVGEGRRLRAHGAYHGGRLLTYVGLGALAGGLGGLLDVAGALMGMATLAAAAAGAAVAGWGALKLLSHYDARWAGAAGAPPRVKRVVGRVVARLHAHPPAVRALGLGLSSALLPCGWLYAFVAVAAGRASVAGGAVVMFVFWLGTVPALTVVGEGVRRLAGPLASRLPVVSAMSLIVVGLGTVWMRAGNTSAMDRWLRVGSAGGGAHTAGVAEAGPTDADPSREGRTADETAPVSERHDGTPSPHAVMPNPEHPPCH